MLGHYSLSRRGYVYDVQLGSEGNSCPELMERY